MKRIIPILALFVLACGCSLDETLYDYVDESTYITDASSARNVLYGVYRELGSNSLYGYYLSIVYDLPTDIAKVDGNAINNNRDICCNAHSPSHAYVQATWTQAYRVIYYANDFMEKARAAASAMGERDKALVDVYVAEARCIRALMYFELVRLYGGVTLMTRTSQSREHPSTFERESKETIYQFIEKELLEAAEILPWATDDPIRSDNSFMFSKGGALGILARAYLTWAGQPVADSSKWSKAADICRQIVGSGCHGLLPDYEDLWKNLCNGVWDPTESLVQISFYSSTISSSGSQNNSGYIGKWNGVYVITNTSKLVRVDARYRPVVTFAGSWKDWDKDRRWELSIADYSYDGSTQVPMCSYNNKVYPFSEVMIPGSPTVLRDKYRNGLYCAKYDLMKYVAPDNQLADGNYSNCHWYLMRYADVLLMLAEAVNESEGPTQEAYDAVNAVRRRAFGKPQDDESGEADLAPGMSADEFREAVRTERAHELCFEGQRKQDLIRWGIYYEKVMETYELLEDWREGFSDYYVGGEYTIKGRHELLPIPQREMDKMEKYYQNPNWE